MKSKVFFSSEITAEKVVELFHAASNDLPGGILPGKVAVKLHSGETRQSKLFETGILAACRQLCARNRG